MACFHIAGVTCENCIDKLNKHLDTISDNDLIESVKNSSTYKIYEQGRKDAIDEVLILLRSNEAARVYFLNESNDLIPKTNGFWADWIESKLKGDGV